MNSVELVKRWREPRVRSMFATSRDLYDEMQRIGDNMADLIEKQDRLLGLLREYYTMSYTPDLAPRLDELKKEIDKQIKQEETL